MAHIQFRRGPRQRRLATEPHGGRRKQIEPEVCTDCKGWGTIREIIRLGDGGRRIQYNECETCLGEGEL